MTFLKRLFMILTMIALCVSLAAVSAFASDGGQYYVAGTSALCGSEWQANDVNNLMTEGETGIYTKTFASVLAGTYEFKVTKGNWEESWGDPDRISNYLVIVPTDGSVVTVIFDALNELVSAEITCPHNCKHNYESIIVAPNCTESGYSEYTCVDCGCDYKDDFTDKMGHEEGDDHKCIRCGVCCHIYDAGVETPATCTEYGYITQYCIYCGNKYEFSVALPTGHEFGGESVCAYCGVTLYYVAGNSELCGSDWYVCDLANVMTEDGNGIYTKIFDNVNAGSYQLKVTDGTWNNSWGDPENRDVGNNYKLIVSEDGSTVTVTFDLQREVVSAVVKSSDGSIYNNEGVAIEPTFPTEETTIPESTDSNHGGLEDVAGEPDSPSVSPVWIILCVLAGCVLLGGIAALFLKYRCK